MSNKTLSDVKLDLVPIAAKLGIGAAISDSLKTKAVRKVAGLDWEVVRSPVETKVDKDRFAIPRWSALTRSDNRGLLTFAPDTWYECQNKKFFDFIQQFVEVGHLEYDSAGSFKKGSIIWVLAKIKNPVALFGRSDVIQPYLLFCLSHAYGKSIQIKLTAIRVSCYNSLLLALRANSELDVTWNHTKPFDPEEALLILDAAKEKLRVYKEQGEFLATKKFRPLQAEGYFSVVFPKTSADADNDNEDPLSRNAKKALASIETQPGADSAPGTWWQLFNAATYNIDHVIGRSAETRINSAWFGNNRKLKDKALNTALTLAAAA